jgi:hypothetical protein
LAGHCVTPLLREVETCATVKTQRRFTLKSDIRPTRSPAMRLFVTSSTAVETQLHLAWYDRCTPVGFAGVLFRRKDRESGMSRYKSKQQAKTIERDFPHVVEIAVPPDGLGSVLIAMYEFHARHGIEAKRGHGRREHGGNFIRWCFADPGIAKAFESEFG